ncbi:MAG: hypothetical protein LH629_12935, partial [Ignavibacteria bacterium]|nr:hypothetical protein [Ignavibacteria bacterium]
MNFIKNILPVIVWIFSLFLTFLFFPSILAVLLSLIFPAFILIKWLGGTSDRIDSSSTSKSFDDFIDSKFQSEIPRSEPDIQYIDNLISKYELKALQGFPKSLFIPANYNGWNFLVTLFLLLSTTYFLTGFAGFIFIHNNWLQNQSSGFIPLVWNLIFGDGASSKISTTVDLFFRFLVFICNYCLAWIVFDPKEAEG